MKSRLPLLLPLVLGGFVAGLLLMFLPKEWAAGWSFWPAGNGAGPAEPGDHFLRKEEDGKGKAPVQEEEPDFRTVMASDGEETARRILELLERRLQVKGARENEALLSFKNEEAYRRFLERAATAGLKVIDQMDAFRTVRVGYADPGALQQDLLANAADYGDVMANYYAYLPETPVKEDRAAQMEVPFGDGMLGFLGAAGENGQWGKGITIAVLDSGVAADARFGEGRLRYLDIGQGFIGTAEGDGHGTAVAYIAAGEGGGVAPASDILSIRVTGADGTSDLFTLAKGIQTAVDAGSPVVVISLGAYQNSLILTQAIDYAYSKGAVIVAASGNDQAARMTWPAADPRVISVGAVDALGQQATFSNSGEGLKLTAPGYGINAAWLNSETVVFDGTSASAPAVGGGIAAMMSQYPGLTSTQAADLLQQYSSDGGAPGQDSAYGAGTLNMGWAMNYSNTARVDTAVSSHYFNNTTGQMEFVIQNRSGAGMGGMSLVVTDSTGQQATWQVPYVNAGASLTMALPVNMISLNQAESGITYRSQLQNPDNTIDVVPANNQKASTVSRK